MSIAQEFLDEFNGEAKTTRRFLERVPFERLNWKAHDKSMSVGELALHIATFPAGVLMIAREDQVPVPDFNRPRPQPENVEQILERFDESVTIVNQVLPTISDEQMAETWSMTKDGKVINSMPRKAFIRSTLLNHGYHHRGQLGVYLRLLGALVPSAYGPSGDEMPSFFQG